MPFQTCRTILEHPVPVRSTPQLHGIENRSRIKDYERTAREGLLVEIGLSLERNTAEEIKTGEVEEPIQRCPINATKQLMSNK